MLLCLDKTKKRGQIAHAFILYIEKPSFNASRHKVCGSLASVTYPTVESQVRRKPLRDQQTTNEIWCVLGTAIFNGPTSQCIYQQTILFLDVLERLILRLQTQLTSNP